MAGRAFTFWTNTSPIRSPPAKSSSGRRRWSKSWWKTPWMPGARRIEVEIRQGGKEYIRVTDDGAGMAPEQVPLAFRTPRDQQNSLGRRLVQRAHAGLSRRSAAEHRRGGGSGAEDPDGRCHGRRALHRDGRPSRGLGADRERPSARPSSCGGCFSTPPLVTSFCGPRPRSGAASRTWRPGWPWLGLTSLSRLLVDGRQLFATPGDGDLAGAVTAVYGEAAGSRLVPVDDEQDGLRVHGFVGSPEVVHGNRDRMSVFLNGRWIQSAAVLRAIEQGYETLLPPRRYPLAVVHLTDDPAAVDVNVHPAKAEVRFKDDRAVFRAVLRAVRGGLLAANLRRFPFVGTAHRHRVAAGRGRRRGRWTDGRPLCPADRRCWSADPSAGVYVIGHEAAAAEAAPAWPSIRTAPETPTTGRLFRHNCGIGQPWTGRCAFPPRRAKPPGAVTADGSTALSRRRGRRPRRTTRRSPHAAGDDGAGPAAPNVHLG